MRLLVDESTGKRLAELLKKEGHNTLFVGDAIPSATDEEVIKKAKNENRILVTDDKDFGELVFRMKKPVSGVILLRTATHPDERLKILVNLIKTYDLTNKFIVVKEGVVRIRTIKP
ncbi:MAG: DUF5615 family PIN-like protein [Candidatus Altiarchaeota archaeon]